MQKNLKFRNHFLLIVENLVSLWILWLYIIITITGEGNVKEKISSVALICAILLVFFVVYFISWRKTTYMFDENSIVVEKNTISKKVTTIAMSNVSTVNINRSFIQAILGTRTVKVDTNSTLSTNSEITICLKADDAYAFQQAIMNIIGGNGEEVKEEINVSDQVKTDASVKDILLHCLFTMKIVEIIVIAVAGGFMIMTESALEEGDSIGGVMGIISTCILVGGVIITFLKSFFAYYKLNAVRNINELNVSYGFFDKKTFKIPVNKIVSIKIVEPLIGRIFKMAYAEVVCVGMGDEEKELSLLTLCMDKHDLKNRLFELLPEMLPKEIKTEEKFYKYTREEVKALAVRLLRSFFYIACFVVGGILGIRIISDDITEIFGAFGVVLLVICIVILVFGILKNKTSGYGIYDEYIRVVSGAFNRTTNFIPYNKIEYMTIKKSPVYLIFGLAMANIATKSGKIVDMLTQTCYMKYDDILCLKEKYHHTYKR